MSTLPPQYRPVMETGVFDELPADVKQQIITVSMNDLPQSVTREAEEAMANEITKSETQDELMQEVVALGDSVIKADDAFERVRVGLGRVDNNNYMDEHGRPVEKFQPKWVGYQKRWTDLLWESRSTATATRAYINDFVRVVVPGVEDIQTNDDLADARLDLEAFARRTDPYGNQLNSTETADLAQKHSQAFTDLRRDLEEFRGTFDDFAKHHGIELEANIQSKQNEIEILDYEIKKCETVVMAMGIALGVTVVVAGAGAVGALAAMGPLGPFVALGVLIVGAAAAISQMGVLIAYAVKANNFRAERDRAQAQLESLKAQLEQLKQLRAILESQKEDITDICARIDRFASIWAIVRRDSQLIAADLDAAIGDEGSRRAFQQRVRLIKESYVKLGDALGRYAITVNRSRSLAGRPPAE